MAEITLNATTGRELGTGPSKRLRVDGKVPAVVYGLGAEPQAVTVVWRELREALVTEAGTNVLLDLVVDGASTLAVVKEIQRHAIRGNVLHVDFLRVSADQAISVDVPVTLEGEASAVLSDGGTVDQVLFALTVNAKPADIPNELTFDVSGLAIGDTVRVADLVLPSGVTTDVDGEEPVVTAQAPAAGEADGDEGDGEEPAEGAAADADGEAAPAAEGDAEG